MKTSFSSQLTISLLLPKGHQPQRRQRARAAEAARAARRQAREPGKQTFLKISLRN